MCQFREKGRTNGQMDMGELLGSLQRAGNPKHQNRSKKNSKKNKYKSIEGVANGTIEQKNKLKQKEI